MVLKKLYLHKDKQICQFIVKNKSVIEDLDEAQIKKLGVFLIVLV